MNTSELTALLNKVLPCTRVKTWCVLSRDQLETLKLSKFPAAIAFNSKPLPHKGEHWLGLYYTSSKTYYFIDSFGNVPKKYGLKIHPKARIKTPIQQYGSSTCGKYVLLFLTLLARGEKFKKILHRFKRQTQDNEKKVEDFHSSLKPCKFKCKSKDQLCKPFSKNAVRF